MAYSYVTGAYSADYYPPGSSVARKVAARLYYQITETPTTYKIDVYGQGTIYKDNLTVRLNGALNLTGLSEKTGYRDYTYSSSGTNHTGVYYTLCSTMSRTIPKTTSAQTATASMRAYWTTGSARSSTATHTFNIPALAKYTISFNANGGSGAPSSQTKWYGTNLTLSSTVPTRSGYTFVGWGTSSSATTATYQPGGTYSANSAATLYAIWKKTLTLSYNANGGSSAPSSQSATVYNATTSYKFTISATKPTRTGYDFLGWATSASATTASYQPGGNITISSSTTLYAVWKAKPVYVKVSGAWKSGYIYVKVNGTWKEAATVSVKKDGTWHTI